VTVVVDTNVVLVANRQHSGVSESCSDACANRLHDLMKNGRIAIDDGYRILKEYQNRTQPRAGKGPGDLFVKWVLQNTANRSRWDQVALATNDKRGFESFPDDSRLANFDPSDRKFVAVAARHEGRPPILQAADSKWVSWAPALREHGVPVEFVCPKDIQRFHDGKTRKGTP
jgi:hypothetical protein